MIPLPRASQAYRISNCPGSHIREHLFRSFGILPNHGGKPNPYALTGTRQHQALAGEEVDLEEEEKATVDESKGIAEQLRRELGFSEAVPSSEVELSNYEWTGHIDYLVSHEKRALLIDFKQIRWGEHDPATINDQIRVYVALVYTTEQARLIHAAIVQPGHSPEVALFDAEAIAEAVAWASNASDNAMQPDAPLNAGDWCARCPLKVFCPEGRAYVMRVLGAVQDFEVEAADPQILGYLLDRFKVLEAFKEAYETYCRSVLAENPEGVTGWSLRNTGFTYRIKDYRGAKNLAGLKGIPARDWHRPIAAELLKVLREHGTPEELIQSVMYFNEKRKSLTQLSRAKRKALKEQSKTR